MREQSRRESTPERPERLIVEITRSMKGPFQVQIHGMPGVLANGYGPCWYSTPTQAIERCIAWHLEQEYGAIGEVLDAEGNRCARVYCDEFPPDDVPAAE